MTLYSAIQMSARVKVYDGLHFVDKQVGCMLTTDTWLQLDKELSRASRASDMVETDTSLDQFLREDSL